MRSWHPVGRIFFGTCTSTEKYCEKILRVSRMCLNAAKFSTRHVNTASTASPVRGRIPSSDKNSSAIFRLAPVAALQYAICATLGACSSISSSSGGGAEGASTLESFEALSLASFALCSARCFSTSNRSPKRSFAASFSFSSNPYSAMNASRRLGLNLSAGGRPVSFRRFASISPDEYDSFSTSTSAVNTTVSSTRNPES